MLHRNRACLLRIGGDIGIAAGKVYQQKSPFYFRGELASKVDNFALGTIVFCKIWWGGDSSTHRADIDMETENLRTANQHVVPTRQIIEELTGLDIEYPEECLDTPNLPCADDHEHAAEHCTGRRGVWLCLVAD